MRPRPDADRRGRGAASAHAGSDRRRSRAAGSTSSSSPAGCSGQCGRTRSRPGIDDPVVCYQGAVVAEPTAAAGCATSRSRSSSPARRSPRSTTRASDSTATSTTSCTSREVTPEARRYADFQHLELHAGRRPARLARRAADEARRRSSDPERARRRRSSAWRRASTGASTSRSRFPISSSSRSPDVTKAAGLDFLAEHLGFTRERTVAFGDGENDVELVDGRATGSPSPTRTSASRRSPTSSAPRSTRRASRR